MDGLTGASIGAMTRKSQTTGPDEGVTDVTVAPFAVHAPDDGDTAAVRACPPPPGVILPPEGVDPADAPIPPPPAVDADPEGVAP